MPALHKLQHKTILILAGWMLLSACGSSEDAEVVDQGPQPIVETTSTNTYAKYIELAGFRLREPQEGKLQIKVAAINHSEGPLGDMVLKVDLTTIVAKPGDPPLATFELKIPDWKADEVRDVSATIESQVRVYEIPDWQYLRATFDIPDGSGSDAGK